MKALLTEPAKLEVQGLSVRFGGLVALDNFSLEGAPGTITGLIGPNGAGKTTTFNACTGIVPTASGSVQLGGRRLDGASAAQRAQRGLGRTFQRMQLFEGMTVLENVALGLETRYAGRHWWCQAKATRWERSDCREAAAEALEQCGISQLAGVIAGNLPTGQRRLVEMARVIAGRFRFLLLDEPSSGLDEAETENFSEILLGVVRRAGTGILLVEHDVALVRDVCTYIYVLDFGKLIFHGPTADVLASEIVHAAYLGAEDFERTG